ncbi:MAG: hypothetical protein U1E76_13065 [Planctomycetota bacterium]
MWFAQDVRLQVAVGRRFSILSLLCLALMSCSAASANPDGDFGINLWPLFESHRLPEGGRRDSALLLFHRTTDASGATRSFHVLNYLEGEDYRIFFPFVWSTGSAADHHLQVVPFYFGGPDHRLVPPLLSAWWRWSDGSTTTWLTPLYHETRDAEGRLESRHLLAFLQGRDYSLCVPLYFAGRSFWAAPLALCAGWDNEGGGRTTWLTPLFHRTTHGDGTTASFHVVNYFSGADYDVFFPLFFASGDSWTLFPLVGVYQSSASSRSLWLTPLFHHATDAGGARSYHVLNYFAGPGYRTLFPLYFEGDDYLFITPLLSATWTSGDGSRSTWITPLFHQTVASDGTVSSRHLLTYYATPDSSGLLPFYLHGPSYTVVPPLLLAAWGRDDGSHTTWVAPFFHHTEDRDGHRWWHLLNYVQGPDHWLLFPLAYGIDEPEGQTLGIVPLYFQTARSRLVLPLLSGWLKSHDDAETLWLTPLYHQTCDQDGNLLSRHLLTFYQEGDFSFLFPFAYSVGKTNGTHRGLLPLWVDGPGYDASPLLLSGLWHNDDGDRSLWITPLFHARWNDQEVRSWHLLNYFSGPDYDVWFPLYFSFGESGRRSVACVPLYFASPRGAVAPLCLSGWWKDRDQGETTWITPLFHETRAADGNLTSWHIANYFAGDDYHLLFPLYFQWTRNDGADRKLVPLLYSREELQDGDTTQSLLGPLITWRRGRQLDTSLLFELHPFAQQSCEDGSELNLLWRLFHTRSRAGADEVMVGPFYSSERPSADVPSTYQILGGLFARDCNYATSTYRYRLFWFFPIGARTSFASDAAVTAQGE